MKLLNSRKEQKQIVKIIKKITGFNYNWKNVEMWAETPIREEIPLLSKDEEHFLYLKLEDGVITNIKHLPLSSKILVWESENKNEKRL